MYLDKRLKELLTAYELRIVALEEKITLLEADIKALRSPAKKGKTEES